MLAHAGHWLSSLIYIVPVLLLLLGLLIQRRRDKRSGTTSPEDIEQPSLDDVMDDRR